MRFLKKMDSLCMQFNGDACSTLDSARLYGVYKPAPPLAQHILFMPMSEATIKDMLFSYKRTFPDELLKIYRVMNGADLFWSTRKVGKIRIPFPRFVLYGVPMTCDRKHIEPFNISIEDLNRPQKTPESWLKFGSYLDPNLDNLKIDLFVDTESHKVFSVLHGAEVCEISESWDTVDEALCAVFDTLAGDGVGL